MDNVGEKIGFITAKAELAHQRIDQLDNRLANDLRILHLDVKNLSENMNKSKGWMAALVFLSGFISSLIQYFVKG